MSTWHVTVSFCARCLVLFILANWFVVLLLLNIHTVIWIPFFNHHLLKRYNFSFNALVYCSLCDMNKCFLFFARSRKRTLELVNSNESISYRFCFMRTFLLNQPTTCSLIISSFHENIFFVWFGKWIQDNRMEEEICFIFYLWYTILFKLR